MSYGDNNQTDALSLSGIDSNKQIWSLKAAKGIHLLRASIIARWYMGIVQQHITTKQAEELVPLKYTMLPVIVSQNRPTAQQILEWQREWVTKRHYDLTSIIEVQTIILGKS